MGSCFGKCLPNRADAPKSLRNLNLLPGQGNGVEFTYLVEENSTTRDGTKARNFLTRLFNKRNNNKKPVQDLVNGLMNPNYSRLNESQRLPSTGSCTSRDIQLQCLDARALLARTTTSTPVSSVDLEWEHETLPISMIHDPSGSSWTALPEDLSCLGSESSPRHRATSGAPNSDSDWSRVSSLNSLEWDNNVQVSPPVSVSEDMDTDTQMLLCEIERLTSKTLSETGRDLFSYS